MEGLAGVMLFVWLFAFVLVILWILVPFAIFGIKPLLRRLITEQERTARALERMTANLPQPVELPEHVPPRNPGDNRTLGDMMKGG